MNSTFTLTFGDCAENHVGMQTLGSKASKGFSLSDLQRVGAWFQGLGTDAIIYDLGSGRLGGDQSITTESAYLLVIKNGLETLAPENHSGFARRLFDEQAALEKDTQALMRGRVVNKRMRHNLCFAAEGSAPDYANGRGTVVPYREVPLLSYLRDYLLDLLNLENLYVEGNYYYNLQQCGIGFHGDSERRQVIGVRLGATFPLWFRWYHRFKPVGELMGFDLEHGDLYIMSEKAVGTDWKRSSILTLRHAAGPWHLVRPRET